MKKFLTFIIVLCMAFSCTMFVACTHTHSYATEWSSDATNHWHACTGKDCTATSDLGAHTYANGVCSVCGYAEPATYEVTQTEWNAAFATGNEMTQINTTTYENGMSTIQTYKYKAGVGLSQVQENKMNDEVVYSAGYYLEIDSANDKVYSYEPVFDQDGQTVLGYSKEEAYVDFSQMDEYVLPSELMDMSAYTYNATTKAYEAASIAITDGPTFTNLSVKFKNGALVSFTDSSEGGSMGASTTVLTISRDPVTITFPSAMKTTVTAQEFNYALNLVQRDATVTTTLGSGLTGVMKLDREGRIHVVQPDMEFYVENVVEGSSSKIYMYTKIDDVFYREEISNDDMMDYLYAFIFDFEYSDFDYNNHRYVAQSASTDSDTFTNVSLFFVDGKIIELDSTLDSQTLNVSYNYDDVTVTIPEQYQDVVPSPEPGPAPSSAQVNQAQWNAAFAMGEVLTQIQTQTYESGIVMVTTSKYKENVGMSVVMETIFNNIPMGTSGMYIEIDTVNDKIYMYEPVFSPDYSTILGYSKQETMIDLSEGSVLPPELMDMSKYTFNSTTGAYEAQSITMEIAPGSSVTYTDIAIKFQDGVLVSVTYSGEDGSGTFDTVITTSRDDVTITFPEPYEAPSAGMDQTQWAAMFKVAENMTMTQVSTYEDDSTVVLVGKFASNGMMTTITESNYPGEERISYFEFDIANDTVWRYEEGPEGVYTKVAFPFGYTQYMSNVTIETEDLMNLEDFTYNSALGAYVAETIVGEYQTYTNVAIYVTDGKITTVSYDSEDSDGAFSYVMICTYGDTIVDLPVAQPAE